MIHQNSRAVFWSGERRSFVLHKLFSLAGVVPVGAFLVVHLWSYASAIRGQAAFDAAIGETPNQTYSLLIEALFIWLPLVFHALYGLRLVFKGRSNVGRYPNFTNWMYVLQRLSAVVALAFIVYHFLHFRLPLLQGKLDREDLFVELCASLSSTTAAGIPLVALAYLTGVAAAAFHLAVGLHGFCFSWGITVSRRASRIASTAFGVFGVLLFVIGANTVIYFATGSQLTLSVDDRSHGAEPVSCAELGSSGRKGIRAKR